MKEKNKNIQYGVFDGRFWWKQDKWDSFIILYSSLREAQREAKEYGDDTVIAKVTGDNLDSIAPITNKPKLDPEMEATCKLIYS